MEGAVNQGHDVFSKSHGALDQSLGSVMQSALRNQHNGPESVSRRGVDPRRSEAHSEYFKAGLSAKAWQRQQEHQTPDKEPSALKAESEGHGSRKSRSKRVSSKALASKSSRSRCVLPAGDQEAHLKRLEGLAEASAKNIDVKLLIQMQFEQAKMLMDLQKQFHVVQEIEKANTAGDDEQIAADAEGSACGQPVEQMSAKPS